MYFRNEKPLKISYDIRIESNEETREKKIPPKIEQNNTKNV